MYMRNNEMEQDKKGRFSSYPKVMEESGYILGLSDLEKNYAKPIL